MAFALSLATVAQPGPPTFPFYVRQLSMDGNYGRGPHSSSFSCNVSEIPDVLKEECAHDAHYWPCKSSHIRYETSSAAGGSSDGFEAMLLSPNNCTNPPGCSLGKLKFWQQKDPNPRYQAGPKNVTVHVSLFDRFSVPNDMTLIADRAPAGLAVCSAPDKDDPAPRVSVTFVPTEKASQVSIDLAPLGPALGLMVHMATIPCTPGAANTGCYAAEGLFIGDYTLA